MSGDAGVAAHLDPGLFRHVLGHFCSGITLLTASVDGVPVGMTCQSFFSLSLAPPLVAFSAARTSTTFPHIAAVGACTVNILASDQHGLSDAFSRSGTDKFAGVAWRRSEHGHPIIEGALAWLDCVIQDVHAAGDHYLVTARVLAVDARSDATPLLFFRGTYADLPKPVSAPVADHRERTVRG